MCSSTVSAATYCIYNTDTKEIYSLSNEDDAIMPKEGYTKVILKEDMQDLNLIYPHKFYKYNGKTIITNRSKLEEAAAKEEAARAEQEEEDKIQAEIREMAKERIKAKETAESN
jgi:ligand-binding SRPBCC domain-containing protein